MFPPVNADANLANTQAIDNAVVKNMEGIYSLNDGSNSLGTQFVCKVSKTKVSFFSNQSGILFTLSYGLNTTDGSIQFAGFWRYAENATQGTINFSIAKTDGAFDLIANGIASNILLKGIFNSPPGHGNTQGLHRVVNINIQRHAYVGTYNSIVK